jgi:hypothetical protein
VHLLAALKGGSKCWTSCSWRRVSQMSGTYLSTWISNCCSIAHYCTRVVWPFGCVCKANYSWTTFEDKISHPLSSSAKLSCYSRFWNFVQISSVTRSVIQAIYQVFLHLMSCHWRSVVYGWTFTLRKSKILALTASVTVQIERRIQMTSDYIIASIIFSLRFSSGSLLVPFESLSVLRTFKRWK